MLVNVVAYAHEAQEILLGLEDGHMAVLRGILKPETCMDGAGAVKPALDMMVGSVLSVYPVKQTRQPVA
ncbi:hypothetical protein [Cupriavidus basilensis]|uniref:hypothetical protein n=1 Tax=Cupriavidus basilensis TaxID=68895 RepID=UPI0039F72D3B